MVIQPVLRTMTSTGVVARKVQRQAVERQPGRLVQVHGQTGSPARPVCTLFALAHEASADGKACLLYTSPSPRDRQKSRMPSSA